MWALTTPPGCWHVPAPCRHCARGGRRVVFPGMGVRANPPAMNAVARATRLGRRPACHAGRAATPGRSRRRQRRPLTYCRARMTVAESADPRRRRRGRELRSGMPGARAGGARGARPAAAPGGRRHRLRAQPRAAPGRRRVPGRGRYGRERRPGRARAPAREPARRAAGAHWPGGARARPARQAQGQRGALGTEATQG